MAIAELIGLGLTLELGLDTGVLVELQLVTTISATTTPQILDMATRC